MSRVDEASATVMRLERLRRSNNTTRGDAGSATPANKSDIGVAAPANQRVGAGENDDTSSSSSSSPSLHHVGAIFQPKGVATGGDSDAESTDKNMHVPNNDEQEGEDSDSDYLDDVVIETAKQVSVNKDRSLTNPAVRANVFIISDEVDEDAEDPTKHMSTFVELDDDLEHQDMVQPVNFGDEAVQQEMEDQAEEAQAADESENESDSEPDVEATSQSVDSLESVDLGSDGAGKQ
jgi:hypothetical protein